MKRLALPALGSLLLVLGSSFELPFEHPSEASRVLFEYEPRRGEPTGAARVTAAKAFLATLEGEQRAGASLSMDDEERRTWTNVPSRRTDGGPRFGDLEQESLERALDLVASALSEQGYAQTRGILLADDQLLRGGEPREGFGVESYHIVVFGEPSTEETWGMQLDGHHLAWNATFRGDEVSLSPSFVGTQPSAFSLEEERFVPMQQETERAHALAGSLSEAQLEKARVGPTRGRMEAGAGRDGFVPQTVGLPVEELGPEQVQHVMELIDAYIGDLPEPDAMRLREAARSELKEMHFAWWGPVEAGSDVSYRIQGPSLLIEYACQDLGGDPLGHLHSILRDPNDEYGARLLKGR